MDDRRIGVEALGHLLAAEGKTVWLLHTTDEIPFGAAHIPGSLASLSFDALVRLGAGSVIVVYGETHTCRSAPLLVRGLLDSGVEAYWFTGGMTEWAQSGHPIEPDGWPLEGAEVHDRETKAL